MRSQPIQASCRAGWVVCAMWLSLASYGCIDAGSSGHVQPEVAPAASADPDDVPITEADVPMPSTYAEAVERLSDYRDAIREAVESGHPHLAHRPLDETSIAIERLPAIARTSGVPRREWEQVVIASEDLGESLAEIHEQIDAGHNVDYAAHADTVDSALARLKTVTHADGKHTLRQHEK